MPGEVHGFGDVAVTPHVLATQAAMTVFALGGNAVDAALAANAAQGVVAPETCGIGGDLFALVLPPGEETPFVLDASGPAGSGADPEELRSRGHRSMPLFHPLTVTVPGCVAGWEALSARFGRLPLAEVIEPARRLAAEGFPASTELSAATSARAGELAPDPSGSELVPAGDPPRRGDRVQRPRLAATLALLQAEGADWFYRAAPAAAISEAVGGRISEEDMAAYRPEWVEPVSVDVFGLTGWTTPPSSQGYLSLATARLFELSDPPRDPADPLRAHLLLEAYRSLAAERDHVLADPRQAPVDLGPFLSDAALRDRAGRIDPDRAAGAAAPSLPPAGTAYMCALDAEGMGVSLIQSNFHGMGSGIGAGRFGFLLHDRGAGFDLRPGHPNELAPGKRPLHTLSPSLWTREGRLAALLGTRGGNQQPQIVSQVAAALFHSRMGPAEAQAQPRWTVDDLRAGTLSRVRVERTMPSDVVEGLERRGHRVEREPDRVPGWGPVSLIRVTETGLRTAAADPRVDTASAAAS